MRIIARSVEKATTAPSMMMVIPHVVNGHGTVVGISISNCFLATDVKKDSIKLNNEPLILVNLLELHANLLFVLLKSYVVNFEDKYFGYCYFLYLWLLMERNN